MVVPGAPAHLRAGVAFRATGAGESAAKGWASSPFSPAKKTIASTEPATVSLMESAPAVAPLSAPVVWVQWQRRSILFAGDRKRLLRKLARRLKLRTACSSAR